jgi:hypothetical protein
VGTIALEHPVQTLQLNTRLSNKSWARFIVGSSLGAGLLIIPGSSATRTRTRRILLRRFVLFGYSIGTSCQRGISPQIDEGFAEDDLEANLQRDKYARLTTAVNLLIDELTSSAPDFQLRDACDQFVSYFCWHS